MNDAMRILELESALGAAIDHMRKMPINSITHAVILDSVKALEAGEPLAVYTSMKLTPSGSMVLGVVLTDRGVTIGTGTPDASVEQRHKDMLYAKLVAGYTMPPPKRVDPNGQVHSALAPFVGGFAGGGVG